MIILEDPTIIDQQFQFKPYDHQNEDKKLKKVIKKVFAHIKPTAKSLFTYIINKRKNFINGLQSKMIDQLKKNNILSVVKQYFFNTIMRGNHFEFMKKNEELLNISLAFDEYRKPLVEDRTFQYYYQIGTQKQIAEDRIQNMKQVDKILEKIEKDLKFYVTYENLHKISFGVNQNKEEIKSQKSLSQKVFFNFQSQFERLTQFNENKDKDMKQISYPLKNQDTKATYFTQKSYSYSKKKPVQQQKSDLIIMKPSQQKPSNKSLKKDTYNHMITENEQEQDSQILEQEKEYDLQNDLDNALQKEIDQNEKKLEQYQKKSSHKNQKQKNWKEIKEEVKKKSQDNNFQLKNTKIFDYFVDEEKIPDDQFEIDSIHFYQQPTFKIIRQSTLNQETSQHIIQTEEESVVVHTPTQSYKTNYPDSASDQKSKFTSKHTNLRNSLQTPQTNQESEDIPISYDVDAQDNLNSENQLKSDSEQEIIIHELKKQLSKKQLETLDKYTPEQQINLLKKMNELINVQSEKIQQQEQIVQQKSKKIEKISLYNPKNRREKVKLSPKKQTKNLQKKPQNSQTQIIISEKKPPNEKQVNRQDQKTRFSPFKDKTLNQTSLIQVDQNQSNSSREEMFQSKKPSKQTLLNNNQLIQEVKKRVPQKFDFKQAKKGNYLNSLGKEQKQPEEDENLKLLRQQREQPFQQEVQIIKNEQNAQPERKKSPKEVQLNEKQRYKLLVKEYKTNGIYVNIYIPLNYYNIKFPKFKKPERPPSAFKTSMDEFQKSYNQLKDDMRVLAEQFQGTKQFEYIQKIIDIFEKNVKLSENFIQQINLFRMDLQALYEKKRNLAKIEKVQIMNNKDNENKIDRFINDCEQRQDIFKQIGAFAGFPDDIQFQISDLMKANIHGDPITQQTGSTQISFNVNNSKDRVEKFKKNKFKRPSFSQSELIQENTVIEFAKVTLVDKQPNQANLIQSPSKILLKDKYNNDKIKISMKQDYKFNYYPYLIDKINQLDFLKQRNFECYQDILSMLPQELHQAVL